MNIPQGITEGYLVMYEESGDEIHTALVTEEHFLRIKNANGSEEEDKAFLGTTPLHRWFTQTHCFEPWPYNDIKILGTACIAMC